MVHKYDSSIKQEKHPVIPVAVVGARGYSGLELARILLKHPYTRIAGCFATDSSFALADYLPEEAAKAVPVMPMSELANMAAQVRTVFLATPAEVSAELAPMILAQGADVIDLSGAFRLTPELARKWYKLPEAAVPYLGRAEYGLVPWSGPAAGKAGGRLISNPGCYATSILMALLPLLKKGLLDPATLVIDSKSGATGAGRKAVENLLYCEVEGECLPYRVGEHQHLPEICHYAEELGGQAITPMFTTHLLASRRGIISGIYARLRNGAGEADVEKAFAEVYSSYPLARFGKIKAEKRQTLSLKQIAGSARTEIRYEIKGDQLYLFSLIDNLLKGAASQAIENFNRLNDLPVTTALTELEGIL